MSVETPKIGKVLIPKSFAGPFDYTLTGHIPIGQILQVPFGQQNIYGVLWNIADTTDLKPQQLKTPLKSLPYALTLENKKFIDWVAQYTMRTPGLILKMMIGVQDIFNPIKPTYMYVIKDKHCVTETPARARVFSALEATSPLTKADLIKASEASPSVIAGLLTQGAIKRHETIEVPPKKPDVHFNPCTFSPEQTIAADGLYAATNTEKFSPILLEGITGSGKTEVYFESIASAIEQGKQSLVLLPEIALSEQWLDRFQKRFGVRPSLWHSNMTPRTRRETWHHVISGTADVVVGTRSALFLPFKYLGTIIVDEEHDSSYKQETGVLYQARDMAVVCAMMHHCPVILSSATPSLETIQNVATGRYQRYQLKNRHGKAVLPKIHLLDMRGIKEKNQYISPKLRAAIQENTSQKKQSLIFLNRRGYAPLVLCTACGERLACPGCSTYVIYHKHKNCIQCHHCTYQHPFTPQCPSCEDTTLIPFGPGVERIAEEAKKLFPDSHVLLMTSDTLDHPDKLKAALDKIHKRDVDIIIGTQVMAKGHHFPDLTLVGVIDADMGLDTMDLRASERTYQILEQVAGRAGRAETPGNIYLQTHIPDHPLLQALKQYDRTGFLEIEMHQRQAMQLPPFGRLASIIIASKSPEAAAGYAKSLGQHAPLYDNIEILGPAPAPLHQKQHWHRWRFLIKAPKDVDIQKCLQAWHTSCPTPSNVKCTMDIDPYTFL